MSTKKFLNDNSPTSVSVMNIVEQNVFFLRDLIACATGIESKSQPR